MIFEYRAEISVVLAFWDTKKLVKLQCGNAIIICFCRFTCLQAYKNLLNELGDQAGQHEMIAENLSTSVVQELSSLTKVLKDDRRKVSSSFQFRFFFLLKKRPLQGHPWQSVIK